MSTTSRAAKVPVGSPESMGDWQALLAWRSGDASAATVLAKRYLGPLTRFFSSKVHDPEDAAELVSETFLGFTMGRDRIEHRRSLRSYLFGIAANKLRIYYDKQSKRRREHDDFPSLYVAPSLTSPGRLVFHAEEVALLGIALRRLPLAQQMVVELAYFEELDGPAIAKRLGIPLSTAHTQLKRGRRRLSELMRRLEASPRSRRSSTSDLGAWVREVRSRIPGPG